MGGGVPSWTRRVDFLYVQRAFSGCDDGADRPCTRAANWSKKRALVQRLAETGCLHRCSPNDGPAVGPSRRRFRSSAEPGLALQRQLRCCPNS